jgi:hypothetical protein
MPGGLDKRNSGTAAQTGQADVTLTWIVPNVENMPKSDGLAREILVTLASEKRMQLANSLPDDFHQLFQKLPAHLLKPLKGMEKHRVFRRVCTVFGIENEYVLVTIPVLRVSQLELVAGLTHEFGHVFLGANEEEAEKIKYWCYEQLDVHRGSQMFANHPTIESWLAYCKPRYSEEDWRIHIGDQMGKEPSEILREQGSPEEVLREFETKRLPGILGLCKS